MGSPLKPQPTTSVVAVPVAVVVTAVAQAPDAIALVPSAEVPLAICAARVDVTSGTVSVTVPKAPAGGEMLIVPEVVLCRANEPFDDPATPAVILEVADNCGKETAAAPGDPE